MIPWRHGHCFCVYGELCLKRAGLYISHSLVTIHKQSGNLYFLYTSFHNDLRGLKNNIFEYLFLIKASILCEVYIDIANSVVKKVGVYWYIKMLPVLNDHMETVKINRQSFSTVRRSFLTVPLRSIKTGRAGSKE